MYVYSMFSAANEVMLPSLNYTVLVSLYMIFVVIGLGKLDLDVARSVQ